ncbi:MAG: STAS domain-containing protein [Chlorobi bacterium]|nr:STAS domain-containing protein [Chlorobiota bacterium]
MLRIKQIKNTVLLSFDKNVKLDNSTSKRFKDEVLNLLTKPFTNLFVDLTKVENVDEEGLKALMASHLLSEMNNSQVSLYNVSDKVLKAMRMKNLDTHFYFVDRPKPFSEDLLMV